MTQHDHDLYDQSYYSLEAIALTIGALVARRSGPSSTDATAELVTTV